VKQRLDVTLATIFCTYTLHVYVCQCLSVCISYCLSVSVCLSVNVCVADGGEGDSVPVGTTEEEIALDPEFSEYIDVEGRSTDYTAPASDADLLTDGLRGSELPGAPATVHRSLYGIPYSSLMCIICFVFFYITSELFGVT